MKQLFTMAFRDLGRNRRRTVFSAMALAIGVALLLFMAAFMEGELRNALEATVEINSGHIQVRVADYDEDKASLAWEDLVEAPGTIADQIASLDPVEVATPRLVAGGILVTGDESLGVSVVGIDPASAANAPFRDGLLEGEWLAPDDREGILLGYALANKRGLRPGQSINLMVNTSDGEVDEQTFTIRGVFNSKAPSYDQSTVFLPLSKAQAITRAGDRASHVWVLLNDQDRTEDVVAALQSSRYEATTWREMNAMLIEIDSYAGLMLVVFYAIVLAVTATVVVNTLVMAVFERTREIGILSAIGMRSRRIMAMFLTESALLAIGGIAIGLVMGLPLVYWINRKGIYIGQLVSDMGVNSSMLLSDRVYGYLTLEAALSLVVTALVVTLVASLYPAILAARMEPVTALHGGGE